MSEAVKEIELEGSVLAIRIIHERLILKTAEENNHLTAPRDDTRFENSS